MVTVFLGIIAVTGVLLFIDVLRLCAVTDEYFNRIEKHIVELEKKNAELKELNKELTKENNEMIKGFGCETCQVHTEFVKLNNRITELEKENAELKAKIPKWHKVADGDVPCDNRDVLSDKGEIVYYDNINGYWIDNKASVEIDNVDAWSEIPKFKE